MLNTTFTLGQHGFQSHLGWKMPIRRSDYFHLRDDVKFSVRAQRDSRKRRRKLRALFQEKDLKEYSQQCRRYIRSFDAKLDRVLSVNKDLPLAKRLPLRKCVRMAEELDLQHLNEIAHIYKRPKSTPGEYRYIWSYGPRAKTAQRLVSDCLRAAIDIPYPAWLYTERGVPCAITRIVELFASGAIWVFELDIREFFPSVSKDDLLLALPFKAWPEVVSVVTQETIRPAAAGGGALSSSCYRTARRGVPQGAASSAAITLWIISQLDIQLPEGVHLVVYADNFFVLSADRVKAEGAAKSLGDAIASLPGGPFQFKPPAITDAGKDWANALGHTMRANGDSVYVMPNTAAETRFHAEVDERLSRAAEAMELFEMTHNPMHRGLALAELGGTKAYARGWRKFYGNCQDEFLDDADWKAGQVDAFMAKHGISAADLVGWENGKCTYAHNPSSSASKNWVEL